MINLRFIWRRVENELRGYISRMVISDSCYQEEEEDFISKYLMADKFFPYTFADYFQLRTK